MRIAASSRFKSRINLSRVLRLESADPPRHTQAFVPPPPAAPPLHRPPESLRIRFAKAAGCAAPVGPGSSSATRTFMACPRTGFAQSLASAWPGSSLRASYRKAGGMAAPHSAQAAPASRSRLKSAARSRCTSRPSGPANKQYTSIAASVRGPRFAMVPWISTTCCFMKFSDAPHLHAAQFEMRNIGFRLRRGAALVYRLGRRPLEIDDSAQESPLPPRRPSTALSWEFSCVPRPAKPSYQPV